jgi:hypothetical protein
MAELNAARALFEKAAEFGGRAKKMLVCYFTSYFDRQT